MFKSSSFIERRARQLLQAYYDWLHGNAAEALDPTTPTRALDLANVRNGVTAFQTTAREIIGDAEFQSLEADLQDDVRQLAEESEKAAEEIGVAISPDSLYAQLDTQGKHHLTKTIVLRSEKVDLLKARLHHKRRNETSPAPPAVTSKNK